MWGLSKITVRHDHHGTARYLTPNSALWGLETSGREGAISVRLIHSTVLGAKNTLVNETNSLRNF